MLSCLGGGEEEGIDGEFLTSIFCLEWDFWNSGNRNVRDFICLRTYVYIDIANEKEFH